VNKTNSNGQTWLEHLEEEDFAFMKRFLLNSGSLKQMAADYGVSYPTVRLRLDRMIQKIKVIDEQTKGDEFQITLAAMVADGKLDTATFRKIHEAYLDQRKKEPQ
jgi:hypothetical protein